MTDPLPDEIDQTLWDEACRRADAIRNFLKRHPDGTTSRHVAELATELRLSQATAYRLIKMFRGGGTVLSLVDRKRGRPQGHRVLDDRREQVIHATISAYYLKRTRPSISQLVRDVQTNCISVGMKPPHRRTIVARLEDFDLQKRARRRGEQKIVKETTAVPGTFGASRPLDVVQIDHTKADVFVVDEETREPLGRPWLTLAMDVCSRMVTGFYLTMAAPFRSEHAHNRQPIQPGWLRTGVQPRSVAQKLHTQSPRVIEFGRPTSAPEALLYEFTRLLSPESGNTWPKAFIHKRRE